MSGGLTIVAPGPLADLARRLEERLMQFFPEKQFGRPVWLPGQLTVNEWNALVKRTPCLAICFEGMSRSESQSDLSGPVGWKIVVATKHPDPRARLHGDALTPGLFTLLGAAAAAVHGYGMPGGTARVKDMTHAQIEGLTVENVAIGVVDVLVNFDMPFNAVVSGDDTVAADLTDLAVQWSFDGGATIARTDEVALS
jgi:hypothetical protein